MKRLNRFISVILLSSLLLGACASATDENAGNPENPPDNISVDDSSTPANLALDSDESEGFKAEALSYIRVQLSWSDDPGAQGYQIDAGVGDDVFFPLATLDSSATSYEHFLAPEAAAITYRLTAVGTNDVRTVTVTTPAAVPNPVFVQATMEVAEFGFSSQGPGVSILPPSIPLRLIHPQLIPQLFCRRGLTRRTWISRN